MLRRIDFRGAAPGPEVAARLPRAAVDVDAAVEAIRPVVADVRERGADAVREATEKYDGVTLTSLRVPPSALTDALDALDPAVRDALTECARRTRLVHEAQRRTDVVVDVADGLRVTERYVPVSRVGLYVPGGRVAYPSSVVMNAVPAQVAGVGSLAVASPPQADGLPHPAIRAACALLGVTEVYAVGGAQAVAMFAYGVPGECDPVDLVTGPGNVYVAAAKRLVRGVVGIDAEAGPTEVAVLADETADAAYVAADLRAQAEHDPLAGCLLVTTSEALADAVDALLPDGLGVEAAATVLVSSIDDGLAVVDAWAPEHLEVITYDAATVAAKVRNAGAVFVGAYAPVSLGDYLAGSNHVLPTAGTARHTGGLSVDSFVRGVHVVECTAAALASVAPQVTALGGAEDLPMHVAAVQARRS